MTKIILKPTEVKNSEQNALNAKTAVMEAKSTSGSLTIPSDFEYGAYLKGLNAELGVIELKCLALKEWLIDTPEAFLKTDNDILGELEIALSGGTVGDPYATNELFDDAILGSQRNANFEAILDGYWLDIGHDPRFANPECTAYANDRVLYMYKQMLESGTITQEQYDKYVNSWKDLLAGGGANGAQWDDKNQEAILAGNGYFETGNEPQAGGVIVLDDGGAGHVVFIEGQDADGNWIVSDGGSGYSGDNNHRNWDIIPPGNSPEEFQANLTRYLAGGYYSNYKVETIIYTANGPV